MGSNDSIIEEIIRSYPTLVEKMRSLKYAGSSHGKDPVFNALTVELPPEDQRRYDAILSAIRHTAHTYHNAPMRLLVIQSTYWADSADKTHSLETVSFLDAEEYRRDFIEAVSQRLGLNDCTGCIYWRKLFGRSRADLPACLYCYDTGSTRSHDGSRCFSKCLEANKVPKTSTDYHQPTGPEVSA